MGRHVVGLVSEVPPGGRKIVEVEGRSIGIFNVHGAFHALRNRCPHLGAILCLGSDKGTTLPPRPSNTCGRPKVPAISTGWSLRTK